MYFVNKLSLKQLTLAVLPRVKTGRIKFICLFQSLEECWVFQIKIVILRLLNILLRRIGHELGTSGHLLRTLPSKIFLLLIVFVIDGTHKHLFHATLPPF